jgi:hypothetical protein
MLPGVITVWSSPRRSIDRLPRWKTTNNDSSSSDMIIRWGRIARAASEGTVLTDSSQLPNVLVGHAHMRLAALRVESQVCLDEVLAEHRRIVSTRSRGSMLRESHVCCIITASAGLPGFPGLIPDLPVIVALVDDDMDSRLGGGGTVVDADVGGPEVGGRVWVAGSVQISRPARTDPTWSSRISPSVPMMSPIPSPIGSSGSCSGTSRAKRAASGSRVRASRA